MVGAALFLLSACSKQDKVVIVEGDDPAMKAAIAEARSTLPQFWQVFEKRNRDESDFSLKVKVTDSKGTEHFWVSDLDRHGGKIQGTINNDPEVVASVKLGQRIDIQEADISDWLYMRGGKIVGNRTMIPLLKKMPKEEAEKYRKMLAEP